MNKSVSVCGIVCSECPSYGKECEGCSKIEGKVFWTKYVGAAICPVYDCCVNEKKLNHCGECEETLPCKVWTKYKDPNMSEEDEKFYTKKRIEVLKNIDK